VPSPPSPSPSPTPQPPPEPGGEKIDLKGTVSGLHGSCPDITFAVSGRKVTADRNTEFKKADCDAVKNGVSVEVKGLTRTDGTVRASQIEIRIDKGNEGGDEEDDD
jgi:Domain of unknown function (DUF5666)